MLQSQTGNYVIYGEGNSGKTSLAKQLSKLVKVDIIYLETDKEIISFLRNKNVIKNNNSMKIYVINGTLPDEFRDGYKYIYCPYFYTWSPVNSNDRKINVHFAEKEVKIDELYEMVC